MLFKLSLANVRKNLRNYMIYLFTLILGVALFYVFFAIHTQTAYLEISQSRLETIEYVTDTVDAAGVFVALVLGFLILYANRFLIKRRSREFAVYLTLGMSKSKLSLILMIENALIGAAALAVGILLGIGFSILTGDLVADLFEANMDQYRFSISFDAIMKTAVYFLILFTAVILMSTAFINKQKLINLLHMEKKQTRVRVKSGIVNTIVLLLAVVALLYVYYSITANSDKLTAAKFIQMVALLAVSSWLLFRSVSGILNAMMTYFKRICLKGIRIFTLKQTAGRIETSSLSAFVACMMLFVTICTLCSSFSVRNSINRNLAELCPADFQQTVYAKSEDIKLTDIAELYQKSGYDLSDFFSEYVSFCSYGEEGFTIKNYLGDEFENAQRFGITLFDYGESVIKLSDYNRLAQIYGKKVETLKDNEYIVLCNSSQLVQARNNVLAEGRSVAFCGHTLVPKYNKCIDGTLSLSSQRNNPGVFVFPDWVVEKAQKSELYLIGNYRSGLGEEPSEREEEFLKVKASVMADKYNSYGDYINTKVKIAEQSIGLTAIITFVGLYVGMIFLISCGAIIALKVLSENVETVKSYDTLRKIGAEEKQICRSLLMQTSTAFWLPFIVAVVHSVFGIKFVMGFLEHLGTENIPQSIALSATIILAIYGVYFVLTYIMGKRIIQEK